MTPCPKTNTLTIYTPEGIAFSLFLASPVTRFLAWIIDLACIAIGAEIVGTVVGLLGIISLDFASAMTMMCYFVLSIGYGIVLEWFWHGQTPGKRLLRLRVVDVQGLRLQLSQIVIRNLLRFIDSLPLFYLVSGVICLVSPKSQRLGDLAANTIVIRNPKIPEPDLEQLLAGKYNSFRTYPHLEARLRQRVSQPESAIALQALLRRDELDPEAQIRLFRDIALHFKSIVEFPQEATDGISDEQYMRNVVDAIFRPPGSKIAMGDTCEGETFSVFFDRINRSTIINRRIS